MYIYIYIYIFMSTLSYQFITFIQQILCRENDVIFICKTSDAFFEAGEEGFALSKILQSRSTLIFSFVLPHMKLESSVEFFLLRT